MARSKQIGIFIAALLAVCLCAGGQPPTSAVEYIPGQANRIKDLSQLNIAEYGCPEKELLPNSPLAPPQPISKLKPIPVGVSIHINELPSISDTYNKFQIDGLLTSTWCDPRILSDIPEDQNKLVLFNTAAEDWMGSHWVPQLEFTNRVSEAFYQTQTITLHRNGAVERKARFEEGLGSEFRLEKFPFDQQLLHLYVQSFSWDKQIVKLVELGDVVSLSKNSKLPEWKIKNLNYVIRNHDDPEQGSNEFSRLSAAITISRRSGHFIYKIFLPLGILTFTSIFFLAIPLEAFADRLAFISGLLFTTLAYQIIITSSVPRVPYLTLGDTYTIFLFVFMVSEVFIAYYISQTIAKQGSEQVPTLERIMEVFLPTIFISSQALFAWIALS
ncbi:neurotransmitter-gated ion-channel ligand binding domain protein [Synechococcus sp. SYN20]|uniref:hypothetical protein n=1 Tax=Synechococcus sp. SYN20 TaxID=1050714 RepID=UPI001645226B|nr:hypothetical protein [Synechococcus sp. SYN20]QNJ25077.1 neurotransmitter-gated ion-channel ligand binding domain protein [Synechococcus sp. SYN20]